MEAVTHHALAKQKKDDCKTTTNRNCPIPKEGGSRPAGVGVFTEVVIRAASPLGQSFSIFIVYCQESGDCTILNTSESLSRQTSRRISRHVAMGYVQWELAAKVRILALVQLFPDNASSNRSTARPPISCAEYYRHRQHICRRCPHEFAGVPLRSFGPGAYAG